MFVKIIIIKIGNQNNINVKIEINSGNDKSLKSFCKRIFELDKKNAEWQKPIVI